MPSDADGIRAAHALVDALVAGGCERFVVAPGSRSAPLALAAARHPGAHVDVVLDERAAAFMALGIGRATGRAAAVITTSGTATAELLPAVVEAAQSCVPLVLLTADRPPWLRATGANQTIVQPGLYGTYARLDLDLPPPTEQDAHRWASEARAALAVALGRPAGPVHLNLCFDEPLIPADIRLDEVSAPDPLRPRAAHADLGLLHDALSRPTRGVIVAGTLERDAPSVHALAAALGWPLLAEPVSNVRHGDALAAPQALLTCEPFLASSAPDVVLQVGAAPTSRPTLRLTSSAHTLLALHEPGRQADPFRRAGVTVGADVDEACAALAATATARAPDGWRDTWMRADATARAALDDVLDRIDEPTELRLARDVAALADAPLFAGSSLPVRDLDAAMAPRAPGAPRVLANRGASGIDGSVATVYGIAAAAGRALGLIGDLALLYDASAFLWQAADSDATLVVPDNGGGGIFDLLPSAALPEHGTLFRTPHHVRWEALAAAAGATHARLERAADLPALLRERPALLEVPIDPERSLQARRDVAAAVAAALA